MYLLIYVVFIYTGIYRYIYIYTCIYIYIYIYIPVCVCVRYICAWHAHGHYGFLSAL